MVIFSLWNLCIRLWLKRLFTLVWLFHVYLGFEKKVTHAACNDFWFTEKVKKEQRTKHYLDETFYLFWSIGIYCQFERIA